MSGTLRSVVCSVLAYNVVGNHEETDPRDLQCNPHFQSWQYFGCEVLQEEPSTCNGGILYGPKTTCGGDGCKVVVASDVGSCKDYCESQGFQCAGAYHVEESTDWLDCVASSTRATCETDFTGAGEEAGICECSGAPDAAIQGEAMATMQNNATMCVEILLDFLGCVETAGGDDVVYMYERMKEIVEMANRVAWRFDLNDIGSTKLSASGQVEVAEFGQDPRDLQCGAIYTDHLAEGCGHFQFAPRTCNGVPLTAAEWECGEECKVSVWAIYPAESYTCDGYCAQHGLQCEGAWVQGDDGCEEKDSSSCDATFAEAMDGSKAICKCGGFPDATIMAEGEKHLRSMSPKCITGVDDYTKCLDDNYRQTEPLYGYTRLVQAQGVRVVAMNFGPQKRCGKVLRTLAQQLKLVSCDA